MSALLEVESIEVAYGSVVAVRDVSLAVAPGEILALLGANGAGKTTTLRAVSGLTPARSGSIVFDGVDISKFPPERIARMGVSHVPAGRGIFATLTVEDNLRMARYAAGRPTDESADAIFAMFPILKEKRSVAAGTLSGGQQQQLAIGRALAQRPRMLMLDEMSMGLSPTIVADLFAIVAGLRDEGIAVVMVEQFVTQALAVADAAVILEQGHVVASGAPSELADEQLAAAYLGGSREVTLSGGPPPHATEQISVSLSGPRVRSLRRQAAAEGVTVEELLTRSVAEADR